MEQNGMTGEQEAIEKLNAFKSKLNKDTSGINPLDVIKEKGKGQNIPKRNIPGGNGNKQKNQVQRGPRQPQATPAPARQPGVNPTDLVLGTSLINIFERFGKAFTPSEEAAMIHAINDRCPWYIKRLNDLRQQQIAAARQQQQQDRGFDPDPDGGREDSGDLFDDDGDGDDTEYVPFMDDEDDGSNVG